MQIHEHSAGSRRCDGVGKDGQRLVTLEDVAIARLGLPTSRKGSEKWGTRHPQVTEKFSPDQILQIFGNAVVAIKLVPATPTKILYRRNLLAKY
jgi:hypothetical protein